MERDGKFVWERTRLSDMLRKELHGAFQRVVDGVADVTEYSFDFDNAEENVGFNIVLRSGARKSVKFSMARLLGEAKIEKREAYAKGVLTQLLRS